MSTSVNVYLDEVPKIETGMGNGIRLVADEGTWICIASDDTADLLRQLAAELLAHADLIDVEQRRSRQHLASAAEQVAKMRRDNGEIAPDGICWECKAGEHAGHKSYMEGRCYGCSCPAMEVCAE